MGRWAPATLLALALAVSSSGAADAPARIAAVPSSAVVILDDGRHVRLAGLLTPVDAGRPSPALRDRARACAEAIALGRPVVLEPASPRWDRHGRLVGSLRAVADGASLQARLVAGGCARVAGGALEPESLSTLLVAEASARRGGRGIWTDRGLAVVPAGRAAARVGEFAVVSGVVRRAERHGALLYLDFGDDWRTDFTVRMLATARRALPDALRDGTAWVGRRVRVRGVIFWSNGPMIEAATPGLIESLTPPRAVLPGSRRAGIRSRRAGP